MAGTRTRVLTPWTAAAASARGGGPRPVVLSVDGRLAFVCVSHATVDRPYSHKLGRDHVPRGPPGGCKNTWVPPASVTAMEELSPATWKSGARLR